jgi:hypothetical protein
MPLLDRNEHEGLWEVEIYESPNLIHNSSSEHIYT